MLKYSIIVPVYNVERYLKQCVDSVLSQKYRNFELILIDDGSTDNSGRLCDVYGGRFELIKVVHKVNGGLSSARNTGVEIAEGDYLIFLDSDDYWINDDCLSIINDAIKRTHCDVLVWSSCKYYQKLNRLNMRTRYTGQVKVVNPKQDILNRYEFKACAWDKAIKKNVYKEKYYSFSEGTLSEDVEWSFDLLKDVEHITFLDYQINVYRQRAGSITKTQREKKTADMIIHTNQFLKELEKIEKGTLKINCYAYIAEQYVNCLISGGRSMIIKKHKELFKDSKYVLEYGKTRKVIVVKSLLKILGYKNTCYLLGTAFEMKNNIIS